MRNAISGLSERAAKLHAEFDRAFAESVRLEDTSKTDLLAIRAGAQAFAVRLSEISGLFVDKKITPIPSDAAALRGLAGFRGAMLPVYDLQKLLSQPPAQAPRWLVIAAATPIALAFDAFEGQLRVAEDAILPHPGSSESATHVREFVRTQGGAKPILHLSMILNAINASRPEAISIKESH